MFLLLVAPDFFELLSATIVGTESSTRRNIPDHTHFSCFEKSSLVSSSSQLSSHRCVFPPSPGTSVSSCGQSRQTPQRKEKNQSRDYNIYRSESNRKSTRGETAPSIGKSSNSSSSSSAVVGFCGSLDPEDADGSASTGFAAGPEPSGAAAISE